MATNYRRTCENSKKVKYYHATFFFCETPEGLYYICINCDLKFSEDQKNCFTNSEYKCIHSVGMRDALMEYYEKTLKCIYCEINFILIIYLPPPFTHKRSLTRPNYLGRFSTL